MINRLFRFTGFTIIILILFYLSAGFALAQNTSWQRYNNQQQQWDNIRQNQQRQWESIQRQQQHQQQLYKLNEIERQNRQILRNQRNQQFNNW